jgi:hypothetical protein
MARCNLLQTVMTQLMRLHQITCGHFTADDGTIKDLPCSRLSELMSILEKHRR